MSSKRGSKDASVILSIDSDTLAHLFRADLIAEAYAPEFEVPLKSNLLS